MENSNTLSNGNSIGLESIQTQTSSFGEFFNTITWKTWVILIFVLAFLGFNIFAVLAKGTQGITNFIAPIVTYFGGLFGNTAINVTKTVVDVGATGVKTGVDVAAGTITTGLDVVQQTATSIAGNQAGSSINTNSLGSLSSSINSTLPQQFKDNSLNIALNHPSNIKQGPSPDDTPTYISDDPYSTIQRNKSSGKSGFCYIGEERGVRSCIRVGENDTCMSQDIYPSMDVCVNPSLRS